MKYVLQLCGQNTDSLNAKEGGSFGNYYALKG
jgi:hypothetical protein